MRILDNYPSFPTHEIPTDRLGNIKDGTTWYDKRSGMTWKFTDGYWTYLTNPRMGMGLMNSRKVYEWGNDSYLGWETNDGYKVVERPPKVLNDQWTLNLRDAIPSEIKLDWSLR